MGVVAKALSVSSASESAALNSSTPSFAVEGLREGPHPNTPGFHWATWGFTARGLQKFQCGTLWRH